MDIETLAETIYDDLNATITSVWLADNRGLCMTLECDDWNGGDQRHRFELRCEEVEDHCLTVGYLDEIVFSADHPLLYAYKETQGTLFFSSAPQSAEHVFYELNDFLSGVFRGWVEPSMLLHGKPRDIVERLRTGYGLLAEGPTSMLNALCTRLQDHLKVNVVDSYRPTKDVRVLVANGKWVICKNVQVISLE